mgnify:CR=1 FL=1|tara:strand:+ start:2055 stop:3026 length:972 start_codon:yes stop_codon:yes gene_type:complete
MIVDNKMVGVYVLCAGRTDYLEEMLSSLVKANTRNFTITISNNSSSKDVEIYLVKLANKYGVDYRENKPDYHGIFPHMDSIFKESKFEYTCVLHDDDIIHQNYFDICVSLIENNRHALAVACNANLILGKNPISKKFAVSTNGLDVSLSKPLDLLERMFDFSSSLPPFPAWIYKTSAVRDLSQSAYAGRNYGDVMLLATLLKSGTLIFSDSVGMGYRRHDKSMSAHTSILSRNEFLSKVCTDTEFQVPPGFLASALFHSRLYMCKDYIIQFGLYRFMSRYMPVVKWTIGRTFNEIAMNPEKALLVVRKIVLVFRHKFLSTFKK